MVRLIADTWFPEAVFLLLSWIIFVTIVVLLQKYDQKPVFSWHEIGLNAVVSTLSTASKSSLLFVISSCIGQWTYVLFSHSSRPVVHFDTHDSASRGPWGSIVLLWRYRRRLYRSPPALGAALIILSLFVDPFFQQIIALGERQTTQNDNAVQIPRAVRYAKGWYTPTYSRYTDPHEVVTDFSMQAAIRSGLASTDYKVTVGARCPSTTCVWENYTTLAVCSKCLDITRNLTKEIVTYDRHTPQVQQLDGNNGALSLVAPATVHYHYLPNGLYMEREQISGLQLDMIISSTYNTSDTVSFGIETNLLWSFATIRHHNSPEVQFTALECGLSICLKEVTSKSVNGVLEEQYSEINAPILQDSLNRPETANRTVGDIPDPEQGHFVTTTSYPRQDLILEGNFSIPQTSINSIGRELHSLFFEDVTTREYIDQEAHTNGTFHGKVPRRVPSGYHISVGNGTSAKYRPSPMQVLNSVTDLPNLFDNLAGSITNNLRLNDEEATVVHGTSAVVVYRIRWVYIILPALSTFGGSMFFLLSVWYTYRLRAPLWKSSAVAILKCGATLNGFARDQDRVSELDGLAKMTSFELVGPSYKASPS